MAVRRTTYTKVLRANGRKYTYVYNYSHSEPITQPHIKGDAPEWYAYNATERHVFVEDLSLRKLEIIDPSVIKKAGRPMGAKDSYKRTRSKKVKDEN